MAKEPTHEICRSRSARLIPRTRPRRRRCTERPADAGATKDKEASKDLNGEIKRMVEEAEPKLRAFLDAKQTEHVKRLMLRFRHGGVSSTMNYLQSGDLQAREEDLRARWEALKAEWGALKAEARQGGATGQVDRCS